MKPTLKAPGTERLKLTYDLSLSNFAFKFNLRRYITAAALAIQSLLTLGKGRAPLIMHHTLSTTFPDLVSCVSRRRATWRALSIVQFPLSARS
jgi:hypothetical protein